MFKTRKKSWLFILLTTVYVSCMLISNIIATKTFTLAGYSIPCAVIVFPFTYVLSDVFSECYGYKESRLTCWIAFGINLIAVGFFQLAIIMPGTDESLAAAFSSVLGSTPLTLVASLVAWVVGDLLNDLIFSKLKKKTGSNYSWFSLRAILSSTVGEVVDASIFIPLLWVNLMLSYGLEYPAVGTIIVSILLQAALKLCLELVLSPLTWLTTKGVNKYEQKQLL